MKSVFPGMDPYLEARTRWLGVHNRLLAEFDRQLVRSLPSHYVTELEERLVIDDDGRYRADLSVWEQDADPPPEREPAEESSYESGLATLRPPVLVEVRVEAAEWYLEVRSQDGRLVTTIELLSWSNKDAGNDRQKFLARREEILAGPSHYVEIDLLRGGIRMPGCGSVSDSYAALVSDAAKRPTGGLWPVGLRDRLPTIPIPLLPPDAPAVLNLQETLDSVVEVGRYAPRMYKTPLQPPLVEKHREWAAARLTAAGVDA